MLICPGSSIAWMSTQSYDNAYDGDDDDKVNQEFRAGDIRSLICFSLIKAPSRKGTRLEISSKCANRNAAFGSFDSRLTMITESPVLLWQSNLQEGLLIMYLNGKCFPFSFCRDKIFNCCGLSLVCS